MAWWEFYLLQDLLWCSYLYKFINIFLNSIEVNETIATYLFLIGEGLSQMLLKHFTFNTVQKMCKPSYYYTCFYCAYLNCSDERSQGDLKCSCPISPNYAYKDFNPNVSKLCTLRF